MNRSSVVGWAFTAVGVFVAGFVAMWIVDASVPQAYNLTDPQIWLGAAILGTVGLAGIAWARGASGGLVLRGAGTGLLAAALLVGGFYALYPDTGGASLSVSRTAENASAPALEPNETYEEVPELARALDKLVESNRHEVHVTDDGEKIDEISAFVSQTTDAYNDPFSWRGTTVRITQVSV